MTDADPRDTVVSTRKPPGFHFQVDAVRIDSRELLIVTTTEKTTNFSAADTARQAWMFLLQFLLFFLLEKGKV